MTAMTAARARTERITPTIAAVVAVATLAVCTLVHVATGAIAAHRFKTSCEAIAGAVVTLHGHQDYSPPDGSATITTAPGNTLRLCIDTRGLVSYIGE